MAMLHVQTTRARALDAEINLVPMIDLLLGMISFLLLTAVWATQARVPVPANLPGDQPRPLSTALALHVTAQSDAFLLRWRRGAVVEYESHVVKNPSFLNAGKANEQLRYDELAAHIRREWQEHGQHRQAADPAMDQAFVHCDNQTSFKEVVAIVDALYQPQRAFKQGDAEKTYPAMTVTLSAGLD